MTTVISSVICFLAILIGWKIWPHRLNPIVTGALVWTPAIFLATISREFISPIYDHLNHEMGISIYLALVLGFVSFSIGVYVTLLFIKRSSWGDVAINRRKINIHEGRLLILFFVGLGVYLYAILNSGLTDILNLNQVEVSDSRYALHLGTLSFLVIFIDVASVIFFARMLETGRYLYCLPILISIFFHMATLQKSPTLFLVTSIIFVSLIYLREARAILIGTVTRRFVIGLILVMLAILLFLMNSLRGIGSNPMTTFEWPWFEQIYIYSGATAILNLSSAIEGLVPSNPPLYGLILARPISWHFIDRELLDIGLHFQGVNAATYLIYPWGDFRWAGFLITPFLTGVSIIFFYSLALKKTVSGIMLGVIAFKAIIFTPNTDVIFDPTTAIVIFVALIAHLIVQKRVRKLKCRVAARDQLKEKSNAI